MKKVTVFIASALESLKNERKDLSDYLYSLNDVFSEYIGNQYEIRPFLSEHFDPRYNGKRTQDALNKELINSELAVFIVNSGAGEGTKEEYDVAKKHFAETRKPAIYIFFMEPTDASATTKTFSAIKNELMLEGHYWENFKHIDTVKLRITLSLNAIIHNLPQISMDSGYLKVDDIQLMSLENVSEFANNTLLQHLTEEMRQVEEKYIQIKHGYLSGAMPAYEEEYRTLSMQKEKLSKVIADLQKNIFDVSISMCRDAVHGTITARQKEAYRVFELGDYEGCLSILSEEEIDNDFQSTQERLDEMQRDNARRYIREQTMAIKILYLMQDDSDRFAKIESRFAKAIKVAQRYRVDAFVIYYYASFLFSLRRYQDSLEALEKLRSHYLNCKETEQAGIWRIGKLYNLSGALYYLLRNHEDSAENYKKVYEIGLEIESRSEDPERSPGSGLGRVENNLALLKIAYGDTASAEMLLRSSLIRFGRMVKISRKEYLRDYGEVMKNLMFLQSLTGWKNESDDFYEEAMDCFNQCLAFDDRFMITSKISELYFGYASHFLIEKKYAKAERYYNKALNKVKDFEGIYHTIFEYDIAVIHASLGYLYKLTDRDDESRLHVDASLEIVERLHLICPQVYSADLGYLNRLKSDAPCVSESEHVLHIYHNIMTLFI